MYSTCMYNQLSIYNTHTFSLSQDWQLKLSGIEVSRDPNEEDTDTDSPRTPIGAINPLLIQDGKLVAI